jgi:centrosomal protein CEP135
VKEDCEFKDNKWRAQIRVLESERNDWKFISQRNGADKTLHEEISRLERSRNVENNFGLLQERIQYLEG